MQTRKSLLQQQRTSRWDHLALKLMRKAACTARPPYRRYLVCSRNAIAWARFFHLFIEASVAAYNMSSIPCWAKLTTTRSGGLLGCRWPFINACPLRVYSPKTVLFNASEPSYFK